MTVFAFENDSCLLQDDLIDKIYLLITFFGESLK